MQTGNCKYINFQCYQNTDKNIGINIIIHTNGKLQIWFSMLPEY